MAGASAFNGEIDVHDLTLEQQIAHGAADGVHAAPGRCSGDDTLDRIAGGRRKPVEQIAAQCDVARCLGLVIAVQV